MNKKQKIIIIGILIIIAFAITKVSMVYGEYSESKTIKVSTQVAKPILIMEEENKIYIDDNNNEAEYKFKVKNYNEKGKITDVQMFYTIQIIANTDETIKYSLYKDEQKIDLIENSTNKIKIGKDKKEEQHYVLKVKYEKTKNENKEDLNEDIKIKLKAEQGRGE